MIFNFTLRLDEVDLALNVLLCNPLSISLRAMFLVLFIATEIQYLKKYETYNRDNRRY